MSSPPPPNPLKRSSISFTTNPHQAHQQQQQQQQQQKRPRTQHPLRQTSFPTYTNGPTTPSASAAAGGLGLGGGGQGFGFGSGAATGTAAADYAPAPAPDVRSDAGSVTGSIGGASADGLFSAKMNKKRGRKSKVEKEREREREREDGVGAGVGAGAGMMRPGRVGSVDDSGSVKGGAGGTGGAGGGAGAGGGPGGGPANKDDAGDDDDDDYDDVGELLGGEEGGGVTDVEAEKKNLALLVDAFNPIQSERYDLYKRAKLRKESLRRIVNHALSQSVPASVVTTINGFTKLFAGEIIEKARTVQAEWATAHDQAAFAEFEAGELERERELERLSSPATAVPAPATAQSVSGPNSSATTPISASSQSQSQPQSQSQSQFQSQSQSQTQSQQQPAYPKREFKPPPNPHRGQLLPAHLREALRRSKRDAEGGGVGYSGMSMGNLGVRGAFTWNSGSVGGRRLFR